MINNSIITFKYMKLSKAQKEQNIIDSKNFLHKYLPQKSKVYTVLCKVSPNGMTRHIKVLAIVEGEVMDIGNHVANILNYRLAKHNDWTIVVGGCGMDMGFHVVSSLAMFLGYNTPTLGVPTEDTNAYGLNHYWL